MESNTIQKSIDIKAPRKKVWDVIVNDRYNRIWLREFGRSTWAETDWKAHSKVVFRDDEGQGVFGTVLESKPPELLVIEYDGELVKGKPETESEVARSIIGGHEAYRLSESNGITSLEISNDIPDEYYEEMQHDWDKALHRMKELAEMA